MKISTRSIFFYLLISVFLWACNSAGALYKKGYKHALKAEYTDAIPLFEQAMDKGYDAPKVNYQIAEAYRMSNRLAQSVPFYKEALNAGVVEENTKFYYPLALKAAGEYKESGEYFKTYIKTGKNTDYLKRSKKELENLAQIEQIMEKKHYYELKNCDGINTDAAEFSPVFFDKKLLFSSTRKSGKYKTTGTGFLGIYSFDFKNFEKCTGVAEIFSNNIYADNINEGSPTFSEDGKMMIFARGNTGEKGATTTDVYLYMSKLVDGEWGEPTLLEINDLTAWNGCPYISPDGKKLYFASNRKGTFGGLDLWVAELKENGKTLGARNMGISINTAGNEMFPYISDDNKLYFSSDGHFGLGSLDLFSATTVNKKYVITNLGTPFNSPADDFAFTYTSDTTGFFSSNRDGGKGDDDIYEFIDKTPDTKTVNYFLTIKTVTINADSSQKVLANSLVQVYDEADKLIYTFNTNEKGNIPDKFPVKLHTDYHFVVCKDDFYKKKELFTMKGKAIPHEFLTKPETDTTLEAIVELKPILEDEIFILENINFDYDKYNVREDAAEELDKLVQLLNDNPSISLIEMRSHTDAVGSDSYNLKLSDNRAKATEEYLIEKGIGQRRLVAKGYGETELLVNTQEANEQNRRTEFKVKRVEKTTKGCQ